jgi:FAD/FMN-containing dehydrogenase
MKILDNFMKQLNKPFIIKFSSKKNYLKKQFTSLIQRKNFKKIEQDDLNYLTTILPKEDILTSQSDLEYYNTDWLKKYKGDSPCVLKPKTTEQISKILKYCNSQKIAVVPQGGNTGLVGGSVPVFDEIIINLSKMNRIISYDELTSTLYCEAGCVLENLDSYLEKLNQTMPIDLGAKGSCFIGGNLATNAGGIHFVKYGSLRKNCKGLKAVTPDGAIIDCMSAMPKNNTGYDLKQLFIGSEGTLGIITECLIQTHPKMNYHELAVIAIDKFEDVLKIYEEVKEKLNDVISAIEFFDNNALIIQERHGRMSPISEKYPFYLIIEIGSHTENQNIKEMLENFLTNIELKNGVIAQDESQKKKIWELRETIAEGASKEGLVLSYDISLPLQNFYKIVEESKKRVGDLAEVIGYGHIGDYNLHLNVCYPKFVKDENFYKLQSIMEPFVYDFIQEVKGSISAEHGIGLCKAEFLNRSQTDDSIHLMKIIKNAVDPNGIMNPYKIYN